VNIELEKVDNWLCANRLSLNVRKSYFSVFSSRVLEDAPVIQIRGQNLDDRLTFAKHVAVVSAKVSR